jgi:hypothetical protein
MLRPWVFVGFTGHRSLANPVLIRQRIDECWERIGALTNQAPPAAVSSAAIGADTLFAQSARDKDIPWTLLLPFPEAVFTKAPDFPDEAAVHAFKALADRAVRKPEPARTGSETLTVEERRNGFLECGLRTVEECDVLLAVWNGENSGKPGGTHAIITYAQKLRKPLLWIHAVTGEITDETTGEQRAKLLKEFPPAPAAVTPIPEGRALLDDTAKTFAKIARGHKTWTPLLNLLLVALHQISIAVAVAALIWRDFRDLQDPAGWTKVGALAVAFVLAAKVLHHLQHQWTSHRIRAQICRSAQAIWNLQLPGEIFPALQLPGFESFQRSLLLLRLRHPPRQLDLGPARDEYVTKRISIQIGYYKDRATKAGGYLRRLRWAANVCTLAAIVLGFLIVTHRIDETNPADHYHWWKLAALSLPLLATTFLAWVTAYDMERRAARYRQIAEMLDLAKVRLEARATWKGLAEVVIEVERALLLETWEWYSVARYSASH